MALTINGEKREVAEGTTVTTLLEMLKAQPERVVVEVNLTILKRAEHPSVVLQEGDRVEIVRFVGGGSLNRSRLKARGSRQTSSLEPSAWNLELRDDG